MRESFRKIAKDLCPPAAWILASKIRHLGRSRDLRLALPSERSEQAAILKHVEDISAGSFLDIGAYDGRSASNTYMLAERGWSGVCVEPSPVAFCKLIETYKNNSKVRLFNGALEPETKISEFHDAPFLSSTRKEHVDWNAKHRPDLKFDSWFISTVGMVQFFQHFDPSEFHVLSIDTEWTTGLVTLSLPLARMVNLRVLCYEIDNPWDAKVHAFLESHGFSKVHTSKENYVFARGSLAPHSE